MRRSLLVVLLAVLVSVPAVAKLPSHPESIKPLFAGEDNAICTAWSLDEKRGLWMTAAHCTVYVVDIEDENVQLTIPIENLMIDGRPVTAGMIDIENDLAVLQADVHAPALKLGSYPKVGDLVTVYGYPGGWQAPLPTWHFVSNPFFKFYGRDWMLLDGSVWPGHSGSPIIDRKGRVIGLVQAHGTGRYTGMTFASSWSTLNAFIVNTLPQ